MEPIRVRKKPVVVEAMQLTSDDDMVAALKWMERNPVNGVLYDDERDETFIHIVTLEGTMEAHLGDWVIKGVQGEFYPCKPDIFFATYEAASVVDAAIFEMGKDPEPEVPVAVIVDDTPEEPVLTHEKLSDVVGHEPTETGPVGPALDPSLVESQDEDREASEGERVSRTRTGPVGPSIVDTEARLRHEG